MSSDIKPNVNILKGSLNLLEKSNDIPASSNSISLQKETEVDVKPLIKVDVDALQDIESDIKIEVIVDPDIKIEEVSDDEKCGKRRRRDSEDTPVVSKKSASSNFIEQLKNHSTTPYVVCPFCERRVKKNYFPKHMRIHTGEKPYKCTECSYSAANVSCLKKHKEDFNH